MNLVGKIFTVLILLMSIVFATFSIMVYSTHRNCATKCCAKAWAGKIAIGKKTMKPAPPRLIATTWRCN